MSISEKKWLRLFTKSHDSCYDCNHCKLQNDLPWTQTIISARPVWLCIERRSSLFGGLCSRDLRDDSCGGVLIAFSSGPTCGSRVGPINYRILVNLFNRVNMRTCPEQTNTWGIFPAAQTPEHAQLFETQEYSLYSCVSNSWLVIMKTLLTWVLGHLNVMQSIIMIGMLY